jgi:SAM-dependent methyltransferase
MSDSEAWDARYAGEGLQFGAAPNRFLESLLPLLRPGMRALCVGDGEGRNGVWLARQGLSVTSVDWSPVGLEKARAMAAASGVELELVQADVATWEWPEARFDLVAWIYVHLPPADRAAAAAGVRRALVPGGRLALECFTPAQEGRRSGGPKDPSLLWTRALVQKCFPDLEVEALLEGTVLLDEGPRHQGHAEVVRALLKQPG